MEIVKVNVANTRLGDKILVLDDATKNPEADPKEQANSIFEFLRNNLPNETWCALVGKIHKEFNAYGYRN